MDKSTEKKYPSSEDSEQEAVIEYCDLMRIPVVHIPNEGKRSVAYEMRMKRMGLRSGFPDLFVPLARGKYHGLFIEMKYGKNKLTTNQKEWLGTLSSNGYACLVCYSAGDAIDIIDQYIAKKEEIT